MPFDVVGSFMFAYGATKALDGAVGAATPAVRRLFREEVVPWWRWSLAENYLSLTGKELVEFYQNEVPIEMALGDQSFVLPATVSVLPNGNGELEAQRVVFRMSSEPFSVSASIDAYTAPVRARIVKHGRYFDGRVVRVSDVKVEADTAILSICPASYFEALCTNFAVDNKPEDRSKTLREFLHGGKHRLEPFHDSELVNHMGVVCMIETSDGMLVFQNRSRLVANRPKTVSASASGAVAITDILGASTDGSATLSAFALAAFRETLGELGVEPHSIRFLGIIREYLRGGKPDAYFFARSSATLTQIRQAHKTAEEKRESNSIGGVEFHGDLDLASEKSRYAFQKNVIQTLEKFAKRANFTFVAGTLMTARHLLDIQRP